MNSIGGKFTAEGGDEWFQELARWESTRREELARMFAPYIQLLDDYARLACRIVQVAGRTPPKNVQEQVIRDLMADVYDFLRESGRIIMDGKNALVYPTARRAYESLSLMVLCVLDADYAEKWQRGKQIGNKEIREELAKHEFGEKEESTRELYKFFSAAAHPNRETVAMRFLGEGNSFTLGVLAKPSLTLTADYCIRNLELWFWFVAAIAARYADDTDPVDLSFGRDYLRVAERAQTMKRDLVGEFNRLISEAEKPA